MRVGVIIPALDEEGSIGGVVRGILAVLDDAIVIVSDNGSSDATAVRARAAGAVVVTEPARGYGAACLAALAVLPSDIDVVLFADGDGADDPADIAALLRPIATGRADVVIGSRALGERLGIVEVGALTAAQRFGNALATTLIRVTLLHVATDLGPFRAITARGLAALRMDDRDFGWTMQMQVRAVRRGLRVVEVPVHYRRRRTGRSKVSGDLRASLRAGIVILATLAKELR